MDAAVTLFGVESLEAIATELGTAPFDPLLSRRKVVLGGRSWPRCWGRTSLWSMAPRLPARPAESVDEPGAGTRCASCNAARSAVDFPRRHAP